MFGAIYAAEGSPSDVLESVAREFSPRIEVCSAREITLDLGGLERLFGDGGDIAAAIRHTAADRGLRVRIAIAGTRTAARLLVHYRAGVTVIGPGTEADTLAPLPLALLAVLRRNANDSNDPNDLLLTLRRWGLRTLGDFVALPPDAVAARVGQAGAWWQHLAAGEDPLPLVPSVPEERFEQALDLEWPIEGLEPLSFVLGRLMDPLERHLEQRDRGAAVLHVRLHLVKAPGGNAAVHERTLQLPTPIRDARTLRTLALLDLESHPPAAAIERVIVAVDPTPARILQFSLLTRPLPSPEQVSTLMARLNALMGEGRSGAPAVVDSWQPGAFAMQPFVPADGNDTHPGSDTSRHRDSETTNSSGSISGRGASVPRCVVKTGAAVAPVVALRRFRLPIPARVHVEEGKPSRVTTDRRGLGGGRVEQCAGPWRTSGAWWTVDEVSGVDGGAAGTGLQARSPRSGWNAPSWDRDEWDVTLTDGATYRVFRERDSGHWFVEAVVD